MADFEELMSGTARSSEGLDARRRQLLFRAWHRGLREVDLTMGRFADVALATLSDQELGEFEQLIERFEGSAPAESRAESSHAVREPVMEFDFSVEPSGGAAPSLRAVEIPLPPPERFPAAPTMVSIPLPPPLAEPPPAVPQPQLTFEPPPTDLVKEVTLPLNLTMEELKRYRKMKLRITLEVNLLP